MEMKRLTITIAATATIFLAGPAWAGQTKAPEPNPNAKAQGSCVGVFSSQLRRNGPAVREQAKSGTRAEMVQAAREADCTPRPKGNDG